MSASEDNGVSCSGFISNQEWKGVGDGEECPYGGHIQTARVQVKLLFRNFARREQVVILGGRPKPWL